MTSLRLADRIVCPSRVPSFHRPRPFLGRQRGFCGRTAVAAALGAAATAARAPKKAVPEWEAALRLVEAVNQLRGSELAEMVPFFWVRNPEFDVFLLRVRCGVLFKRVSSRSLEIGRNRCV